MRLPSHLVKNRFGVYYFNLVFPKGIRVILKRKETRRSLKTTDRKTAVMMAQEFRNIAERLWLSGISRGNVIAENLSTYQAVSTIYHRALETEK